MAGPFKIEGKAFTVAAKSKPVETASPLVATAEEPVKPRYGYGAIIIIIGIIALAAAGVAIYKKKAAV